MVAEVLVGLQLLQQSCKAIKVALKTTEDIGELGGLINNVFRGQEELKKQSHPIASKWSRFIKGSTSDKFLQMAVTDTIQEIEAKKAIDRLAYLLNRKFGKDTWGQILLAQEENKRRYEEALDAKRKISARRIKKAGEIVGGIVAIGAAIGALWLLIIYTRK